MKDLTGGDSRSHGRDQITAATRFHQVPAAAILAAPQILTLPSSRSELLRALDAQLRDGSAAWLRLEGLDVENDRHANAMRLLSKLAGSRPRADDASRRSRLSRRGSSPIACDTVVLDWSGVRSATAEALALVPLIAGQLQRLGARIICCAPESARTFAALSASGGIVALGNAEWVWEAQGYPLAADAKGMRLMRGIALRDVGHAGKPWWWARAMSGPMTADEQQLELFRTAGQRRAMRVLERALRGGELVIPAPTVVFDGDLGQGALNSFYESVQDTLGNLCTNRESGVILARPQGS